MVFDKEFFKTYQRTLRWFANTYPGRRFFGIDGKRSSVGEHKIIGIAPNAITWKECPVHFVTEFRNCDKFSRRLYYGLKPFWFFFHFVDFFIEPKFSLGFLTLTQFPGSTATDNPVDGSIRNSGATYATVQAASTGDATDITTTPIGSPRQEVVGGNYFINRWVDDFDTSSLGSTAVIISAIKSIWVTTLTGNADTDTYHVVSNTITSTTALATSDFGSFGTTSFGSIALASITTGQYTDITLNANGRNNISLTGVSKFAARLVRDINAQAPTGDSGTNVHQSNAAGTTNDPKLVITYSFGNSNIVIDDCAIENNASDGILLTDVDSMSITNNNIKSNGGWGVNMNAGTVYAHVIGNFLRTNTSGTTNNLGLFTVYNNNTEV